MESSQANNNNDKSDNNEDAVLLIEAAQTYIRRADSNKRKLMEELQKESSRAIVSAAVNGDVLSNAFTCASYNSHVHVLQAFLDCGMNVDIIDQYNTTALMHACCFGRDGSVRLLLNHNAVVNVPSESCSNAPLFQATQNGYTDIVEMLLEKNANPDIQDRGGLTPLMHASLRGHTKIIQLLLNYNADADLKNNFGKTALDLAKDEESKEVITNHANNAYVLK